jgi:uncharacterized protein (DUF58 family)
MDTTDMIRDILSGIEQVGIHVPWLTVAPDYVGSERDSKNTGPTGFDLAGINEWEPGDRLDYRNTARTGWRTKFTLVFEQPRQLSVALFVESSSTIDYGMVDQTKKRLTATLMASILLNTACTSDLASYGIWSGSTLLQYRKSAPAGRQIVPALNAYLDPDAETDETEPSSESGLAQLIERLPLNRRCLVFIISDGLSDADMAALDQVAGMHDFVVLKVGDLRERELPSGFGFRDIEDVATGRTISIWLSNKSREQWRKAFDERRRQLSEQLGSLGIALEEFFTNESAEAIAEKLVPVFAGYRPIKDGTS